jgi:tetratricopeptide (TPR) repeat protein
LNTSIHLHDHLLSTGRRLLEIGRTAEARRALDPLVDAADLTPHVRAEAHSILGEIEFGLGRYRKARRHFAVVIGLRPYDTETCLRYADAVDADPIADPHKAWAARRRATRIDSFDSRCWAALGQSGLRIGDRKRALRAFRRAAKLRPERIETLAEVVNGFVTLCRMREARRALNCARFRRPHDAGIEALWNRFRFDCLHRQQQAERIGGADDEPTILRFPGRTTETTRAGEPIVLRADRQSRPVPHLLRLFGMRVDPRRAN